MEIKNISYAQQNEHYDPEKCRNGGGYDQPFITVEFDDGAVITISDTSCGDFGGALRRMGVD